MDPEEAAIMREILQDRESACDAVYNLTIGSATCLLGTLLMIYSQSDGGELGNQSSLFNAGMLVTACGYGLLLIADISLYADERDLQEIKDQTSEIRLKCLKHQLAHLSLTMWNVSSILVPIGMSAWHIGATLSCSREALALWGEADRDVMAQADFVSTSAQD